MCEEVLVGLGSASPAAVLSKVQRSNQQDILLLPGHFLMSDIAMDCRLEFLPASYGCLSLGQGLLVQPYLKCKGECSGFSGCCLRSAWGLGHES